MEKDTEIAPTTAKEVRGVPFKKGDDPRRNIEGRPSGSLDFKTKWHIFIDKVAKQNGMTPDEIDEQLLAVGFKKAKDGDYAFYRDIQDRVHGKPQQFIDHTTNFKDLPTPIMTLDRDVLPNNSNKENSGTQAEN